MKFFIILVIFLGLFQNIKSDAVCELSDRCYLAVKAKGYVPLVFRDGLPNMSREAVDYKIFAFFDNRLIIGSTT